MKTKTKILSMVAVGSVLIVGAALVFCPRGEPVAGPVPGAEATRDRHAHSRPADGDAHIGHGHAEHEQHEEADAGRDLDLSLEEILAAACEHGILTYRCDQCRYEVGVVRVDPSLVGDADGPGSGLVKPVQVGRGRVETVLRATGEIQLNGNTAAHITPRVSGVINSVQVDIGTKVVRDQVLFEIESVELGQALSEYEKALALTELTRKNLEREESLFDKKISSEREVIEARMAHEQNRAELKAVAQRLHVFGLQDRDFAALGPHPRGVRAGNLAVRAPLAGTVIEKHAVVGEAVDPGRDVLLIADLSTLWVWADIYEKDMGRLLDHPAGPLPVEVSVHAFPGRTFAGEVDYLGATMDERTRTVKVRVTLGNAEGLLRPGMFCENRILVGSGKEALAVPWVALMSDAGRDFVFKRLTGDYFVRREVRRGQDFGDRVEILEGVTPGEVVVGDGAFLLKSDVLRSKMGAGCAD